MEFYNRPVAVLDEPRSIPKFEEFLNKIYGSMHSSSYFTSLSTELAAFLLTITGLTSVQNAFKTVPPTKIKAQRDYAYNVSKVSVRGMRGKVQELADADPSHAVEIINAAGMRVKIVVTRVPQIAGAYLGVLPLTILLLGDGKGNHNFRSSEDGETWTNLENNGTSHYLVTGLTDNTLYYFQSRPVLTKGRVAPWSATFSLKARA